MDQRERQIRHQSGMPTADELKFYDAAERAWSRRMEGADRKDLEVIRKMGGETDMEEGKMFDIHKQAEEIVFNKTTWIENMNA